MSGVGILHESRSGLLHSIKEVGKTVLWAVNTTAHAYRAGKVGICLLCNNLQPYGHRLSSNKIVPEFLNSREGVEYDLCRNIESDPSIHLLLDNVPLKQLLEARDLDPQTQLPKRECRFCRFLCNVFDAFFVDEWMNWKTEVSNGMSIEFSLLIRENRPLVINCINFTWESNLISRHRVDLEVYVHDQSSLSLRGQGALPCLGVALSRSQSAGSQATVNFMREAMRQCYTEHPQCMQSPSGFHPTRLIHLGSSNVDLRLVESATLGGVVHWAALSHCWGDSQPYKLVRDNLQVLKDSINHEDLPPTFQDAVTVCRNLGIQYLWIDSLCIIQQDQEDWVAEASRMGDVYGQSILLICAASAPDCHTSFLGAREDEWMPKSIDFETSTDRIPIQVRRRGLPIAPFGQGRSDPPFTSLWATRRRAGKLYTRGWCFQETFLARRILHFGPGAITFECQTHSRLEDQLPPYPITTPGSLGSIDEMVQWHMIVKLYTQRALTRASDKLPAICGAASISPQAQRSAYIAGLWAETLLADLPKQIMPVQGDDDITYDPEDQKAPSWSWASVNLGVVWSELNNPQWLAQVLNIETQLETANRFGAVTGGSMIIRGHMNACLMTNDYGRKEHWIQCHLPSGQLSEKKHFRTDGVLATQLYADVGMPTIRRPGVGASNDGKANGLALFLCFASTDNYKYVGMVLGFTLGDSSILQRVGIAMNIEKEWYDCGSEHTISVI